MQGAFIHQLTQERNGKGTYAGALGGGRGGVILTILHAAVGRPKASHPYEDGTEALTSHPYKAGTQNARFRRPDLPLVSRLEAP